MLSTEEEEEGNLDEVLNSSDSEYDPSGASKKVKGSKRSNKLKESRSSKFKALKEKSQSPSVFPLTPTFHCQCNACLSLYSEKSKK